MSSAIIQGEWQLCFVQMDAVSYPNKFIILGSPVNRQAEGTGTSCQQILLRREENEIIICWRTSSTIFFHLTVKVFGTETFLLLEACWSRTFAGPTLSFCRLRFGFSCCGCSRCALGAFFSVDTRNVESENAEGYQH